MQGLELVFDFGEDVVKVIYQFILCSYCLIVEQMVIFELGLLEMVCVMLFYVMKQVMDEIVCWGVLEEVVCDFLLGYMNILGVVIFKEILGVFLDVCNKVIQNGLLCFLCDDWFKVFEYDEIVESICCII